MTGAAENGLAGSFDALKLNRLLLPLFILELPMLLNAGGATGAPKRFVIAGFAGWAPVFDSGKLGFGIMGCAGGLAGVDVAAVGGIENVKLLLCWKSGAANNFVVFPNADCC